MRLLKAIRNWGSNNALESHRKAPWNSTVWLKREPGAEKRWIPSSSTDPDSIPLDLLAVMYPDGMPVVRFECTGPVEDAILKIQTTVKDHLPGTETRKVGEESWEFWRNGLLIGQISVEKNTSLLND